ncbi:MAG: hypothetical protein J6L85_05515 [Clostridia bacterium]|nr:hypothetical protein [Clostridia bacterium]
MELNLNSNQSKIPRELGYLVVRVSTALGAIPLEGATVNIRGNTEGSSGVLYSLLTDRDGLTKKVSVPTPPRELSEHPGEEVPFSSWNIDVFKNGYVPVSFQNVPVYSSIVSVQPAVLVPISEGFGGKRTYNESLQPEL